MKYFKSLSLILLLTFISVISFSQTLIHSEDFEGSSKWSTTAGTGCSSYPFQISTSIAQSGTWSAIYPSFTAPATCYAFMNSPWINVADAGTNDSILVKFFIYRDNTDNSLDKLEWNLLDSNDKIVAGPSPIYRYYQYTPASSALGWVEIFYKAKLSLAGTAKNLKLRYIVTGISDNGSNIFIDNIRIYHIKKTPPAVITVTKPNGGETVNPAAAYDITWTSSNVSSVNIDFSINGGLNWVNIAQNVTAATGTYSWTIPTANSSTCKIRISDSADAATKDESNAYFSIIPKLTLTNPNGANLIDPRVTQTITWINSNAILLDIQYTLNGGANWSYIASNVPAANLTYNWTVPKTASTNCKVKITNPSNPNETDESDAVFTIRDVAGVSETAFDQHQFATPNPSSGVINITLPENTGGVLLLSVYSFTGQIIYSGKLDGNSTIDLSGHINSNGIYYLQLSDGYKIWRQKLVLNQ